MSRTLIKNGIIVTLDPEIGDLPAGDVLIGNDKILAVGSNLDTGELRETIDADGMIVMPGLINAHLHTWQTSLRGLGGDWAGSDYFNHLHTNLAPRFTPRTPTSEPWSAASTRSTPGPRPFSTGVTTTARRTIRMPGWKP